MKLLPTLCLLFSGTLFHSFATADESMPEVVRSVEGITEYRLDNGLRILLFPDESLPKVTVNLTVFVGSRHEGYGEAGMAHLLEHMVFKGTPDHPEVPKVLNERGADFNGTTWLDRTNYYETLPASDDNLEFAIRLEADRMVNSFIRGEDLASEMTVVRNEFERGENNPLRIMMQRMMGAAYEWHNYGKSTIGNRADIERVPVANLKRFYQRFYQPDNAMLIVAGKFDSQQALELAQKYFGVIPRPDRELDRTYTEEPAQDGDRLVILRRVGDVPMAGLTYHIPAGAHPEFAAVDVLATVLSSEPAGRLYEELVKKRQAASVFGFTFALHDPGVVLFMAQAAQGIGASDLLQAMIDVVERIPDKPITDEEVDRAKQELLKQWELNLANSRDVAIALSDWAAQGDWRLFFIYRDRLEAVTAEDVNRAAAKYLSSTNRTAGLFEPTEAPARSEIPQTPNLTEMIGEYEGREQIAAGEAFDASPMGIEERLVRDVIDGDIKVTLLPKKTRGEVVNVRLSLRYGNLRALTGKATAARMLPSLLDRGTENMTHQQIRQELDRYRAELGISGEPGRITVELTTKRGNLRPVLNLVGEILRKPSLPNEELELLRESRLASAEQRLTSPNAIASNTVQQKLSRYERDDPRYVTSLEEDVELLKQVTIDDVRDVYQTLLEANNGELTIVGDFDPEDTVPVIDDFLADWRSATPYERISRQSFEVDGSLQKINTPDKAQAMYFAAMTMPMSDSHPDYPALLLGNHILGGGSLSSRLGDRVRQDEGLSYGVGSSLQASPIDERTIFYVYAIVNPENADRLHEVISKELEKLLKDGVTEDELKTKKASLLQDRQLDRTKDDLLTQTLATYALTDRTMRYAAAFEQTLSELTVDDVNAALRKHIDPKRLVIVMAGDFEKSSQGQ
ncbi:MAG: pitrilysin family protein [Planctomycetaceae bacterium]